MAAAGTRQGQGGRRQNEVSEIPDCLADGHRGDRLQQGQSDALKEEAVVSRHKRGRRHCGPGRAGQGGGRCAWPSAGRGGTGGRGVPPRHDGRLWGAVPRPGRGAERERACCSRRASPGQKVPGEFTAGRVENAGRRRRRRRRSCPRRASPCLARPRARRRTPGSALCAAGNRDPARNDSRVRSYALRETCCRTLVRARQWQLQLRDAGVSQAGAAEVLPPTVAHSPPCPGQCPKPGSGFPSPCYC